MWYDFFFFHFFFIFFFFSSRRRHTRLVRDWSSDVCSSDLVRGAGKNLGKCRKIKENVEQSRKMLEKIKENVRTNKENVRKQNDGKSREMLKIGRASCRERV